MWVGPFQDRILAYADELGLTRMLHYSKGKEIMEVGGKIHRHRYSIPLLQPIALFRLVYMLLKFERLVRRTNVSDVCATPDALKLDGATLQTYAYLVCFVFFSPEIGVMCFVTS